MTTLTATPRLIRLALRRDRVVATVWLMSLTALVSATAGSVIALYATDAERLEAAAFTAGNRISRIFDGPAAGPEPGSLATTEAYLFTAVLIGLFSIQTVVRHTRQDEETGRAEMMGAGVVGRHARLAAALVVAFGANLVLAALVTSALAVVNGLPVRGSLLAGASYGAVGLVFAGIAAVAAQIAEQARAANGWASAAIGVAFLVRAVGDVAGEAADNGLQVVSAWPSWLSPIGWGQQLRPYADARPWILLLFLGASAALVALAVVLTDHRDVGSGMRDVPRGPREAPSALLSPIGLAWRQQRWVLVAWATGLVIAGAAFGSVGDAVDEFADLSAQFVEILEAMGDGTIVDSYFAFLMRLLGIATAGYTVQALLRMRVEEAAGRVEPILATAVSRSRWMLSHVTIALVGTALLLAAAGAAAGLTYGLVIGDVAGGFGGPASAAVVQIPAALLLGGVVTFVFAVRPAWATPFGWSALVAGLVVSQFGEVLDLPQAISNVSPFTHPPLVPVDPMAWTPTLVLLALAATFVGVALAAFGHRDLTT